MKQKIPYNISSVVNYLVPNKNHKPYIKELISELNKASALVELDRLTIEDINLSRAFTPEIKVLVKKYLTLKKKYMLTVKEMNKFISIKDDSLIIRGIVDILDNDGTIWMFNINNTNLESLRCKIGFLYYALGYRKEIAYVIKLTPEETKVELIYPWTFKECEDGLKKFKESLYGTSKNN